jgi:hypothetical protein
MKIFRIILFLSGLLVIGSCTKYPSTSSRLYEDLAVLTQYNVKADFSKFKTFSVVDSITYISDKDSGRILDANAQAVLTRIKENMIQRGYTEVMPDLNPDLGINVAVVEVTNINVYYPGWYWGYYGYYPPYWWGYPGYDYYYPYYPVYYSSYSSGTLIIDMADFQDLTSNNEIPIVWNAYIRALLTGNHTISDINSSIDQAFSQTKPFQP